MEDNERKDDSSPSPDNLSPASAETKGRKKQSKSADKPGKANQQKKKSLREGWRSSSPFKKLEMVALIIGAAVGVAYLVSYILLSVWQANQTKAIAKVQHRPRIIFYRPPVLLEPFTTDIKTGDIHVGKSQIRLKNVENGNAPVAYVDPGVWAIIPEKKTGDPERDTVPDVTKSCEKHALDPKAPRMFPMNAGEERTVDINQIAAVTIPPFKQGEVVALYWPICTYYWDDDGDGHGTCLTYRFVLPDGQVSFVFGTSPLIGTFQETLMNYCQS